MREDCLGVLNKRLNGVPPRHTSVRWVSGGWSASVVHFSVIGRGTELEQAKFSMLRTCTRFRKQVEMCRKKNRRQNETKSIFVLFCCELSARQKHSPWAEAGAGGAYGSALHSFWKSLVGRRGRTHFIKVNIFHLVGRIPQRAGSPP